MLAFRNHRWDDDRPWTSEDAAGPPELPAASSPRAPIVNVADVAVDPLDGEPPEYHSEWRDLGRAAGSERTGMSHIRVEAGRLNFRGVGVIIRADPIGYWDGA